MSDTSLHDASLKGKGNTSTGFSNPKSQNQEKPIDPVSSFTFGLFIFFNIDFFLHLSARIPGYGVIRPTLIMVLLLTFLLFSQKDKFKDIYQTEPYKRIKWLIIYLALSFFLVRWPGSALNNLPDFVKAVCFFFFTAMIVDTERRLKKFLLVFIILQLVRVYEPLYLNLTQGYWGDKTHLGGGEFAERLSGAPSDVINPNGLGFVIATIVPFLYYLLWGARFKAKVLFLILLPPILYTLILTMSRGALLALLVVGWMVFWASKYKFLLILAAIGVAMAGWSVMSDVQKDRYLSLVSSNTASEGAAKTADGRLRGMINEMVLGLTTRPVLGNGLGTTSETKTHEWGKAQASHNLYAELLIEVGAIGMFFFLGYLAGLRRYLVSLIDRLQGTEFRGADVFFWQNLSYTLIAVFWMYAVYSVNYYGLSVYYWYLFGGLVLSVNRILTREVLSSGR
ncbi:O-antigen ligase [Oleiphilus sp. HI0125]|uniref:O-antigen ligase family protein n=2 Tax=Oleiphilus sp. HI0125 TaxID=1822266 RepID=UPI0008381F5A|nr:O-antigen ligase family protein [Oleiphilus sp. HI0125]